MNSHEIELKEKRINFFQELLEREPQRYRKWTTMAHKLIRVMRKSGTARHIEADDMVSQIIEKIINGKRYWDMDKVNLDVFIYHCLRSEISNLLKKEEKMPVSYRLSCDYQADEEDYHIDKNHNLPLESILREQDYTELTRLCFSKLEKEGEIECYFVLEETLKGGSAEETAKALNMSVNRIYELRRRIKMKLQIPIAEYFDRNIS